MTSPIFTEASSTPPDDARIMRERLEETLDRALRASQDRQKAAPPESRA